MRLLIAQGPGYYGVNVRVIDEATYERLLAKEEYRWMADDLTSGDFDCVMGLLESTDDTNGKTILIMTRDFEEMQNHSAGFDTGWWSEGEKALDEALK